MRYYIAFCSYSKTSLTRPVKRQRKHWPFEADGFLIQVMFIDILDHKTLPVEGKWLLRSEQDFVTGLPDV